MCSETVANFSKFNAFECFWQTEMSCQDEVLQIGKKLEKMISTKDVVCSFPYWLNFYANVCVCGMPENRRTPQDTLVKTAGHQNEQIWPRINVVTFFFT